MGETSIEWTATRHADGSVTPGYSFNPVWGCHRVAPECDNCYAAAFAHRLGLDIWGKDKPRRTFGAAYWRQPLRWNARATRTGRRAKVFCASMADVFEDHPTLHEERAKLWPLITATPNLDWLLLTKRPQNIRGMVPWGDAAPPANVWLGTTAGTRRRVEQCLPALQRAAARVRFVSVEPLLERLDNLAAHLVGIDMVIVGGESGHGARPMEEAWVREIRDACTARGVSFFYKQRLEGRAVVSLPVIDGRTWAEFPS